MKPGWKEDLDNTVRASTKAFKDNPTDMNLYNGKHWVPIGAVMGDIQKLCDDADRMYNALLGISSLTFKLDKLATSHELHEVKTALNKYQTREEK